MGSPQTILIVDDDADCRVLVSTMLKNFGYEITTCASGKEALAYLEKEQPNLVILDVMMPEMSGYDVVVHMKQRPQTQNIPVLMLTAKGTAEDMLQGYSEYAVDYYIPKPFTSRQLIAGIQLLLDPAKQ